MSDFIVYIHISFQRYFRISLSTNPGSCWGAYYLSILSNPFPCRPCWSPNESLSSAKLMKLLQLNRRVRSASKIVSLTYVAATISNLCDCSFKAILTRQFQLLRFLCEPYPSRWQRIAIQPTDFAPVGRSTERPCMCGANSVRYFPIPSTRFSVKNCA